MLNIKKNSYIYLTIICIFYIACKILCAKNSKEIKKMKEVKSKFRWVIFWSNIKYQS